MTAPIAAPKRREPRRRPRWIPYALGLALVVALAFGLRPQPATVEFARPTRGDLRASVDEEGKTRIRQRYVVSTPVPGQLRRIPLKEGAEVVTHTTVIATIDPAPSTPLDARSRSLAEARRDSARAQLEKARAAQRFAAGDLERFGRLFKENTISKSEMESFEWREAATTKELAAAESALREAEAQLAEVFAPGVAGDSASPAPVAITAPVTGRVLRVLEENARVVVAGTPLVEIGDPSDLEVVIDVLSRDGAAIRTGAEVELHHWGGPQPLQARVRLVEPSAFTKVSALGVEEQRVNVIADLVSPPEQRAGLGDQFRVEARIVLWKTNDVLKVPSGALFRRGSDWAAFAIQNGRATLRRVRLGATSDTESQVVDGLTADDTVILYPGDRIRDGLRVRPVTIEP